MVQESRLQAAMGDLQTAQGQLDEKQKELDVVQAMYDKAMAEKQVNNVHVYTILSNIQIVILITCRINVWVI